MHATIQPPSTQSFVDKQTLFVEAQARIDAWREGMPYPRLKDEMGETMFWEFREWQAKQLSRLARSLGL